MPPKAKFKKEEITAAALQLVRERGPKALTARALGLRLGSSACPVFTVFASMEEVQETVLCAAREVYKSYVDRGLALSPAFKGVGMQYIQFAVDEPKLFQLLFMAEHEKVPELADVLQLIDESYERILSSITDGYGLTRPRAERLYRHLWIYSHGIATLCATGMCRFEAEEIGRLLTEVFTGLLPLMAARTPAEAPSQENTQKGTRHD